MLRLILDRSDDVAIPTESMFIADMAAVRSRFGDLARDEQFDRLAEAVWRHPKVREWRLEGAPPRRDGRSGGAAYRAALEAPYLAYAAQHGKPGWADKTPYYIGHIDELRRVFPDARIVNLVRDGRDVALSLLRVPFGPANVWAAAHQWRGAGGGGGRGGGGRRGAGRRPADGALRGPGGSSGDGGSGRMRVPRDRLPARHAGGRG